MSHQSNTTITERANEVLNEITSHPSGYDKALQKALDDNDMEQVHYLVAVLEAELAQQHFYDYAIIGEQDVY